MKKILKTVTIGLILAACREDESLPVNEEWTQISNWGQETYARCIAVNGETVFVGTDSEIYRSTNNGTTWKKLPPYSDVQHLNGLRSIHIKSDKLFGGEPVDGFIKSTDNGKTWDKIESSIPNDETIYSISSNSEYVFIGTYGSGLHRSNDNGETWENVFATKPTGEPVRNIAIDKHNILIFVYAKGLYFSPDNGNNWTDITDNIDIQHGSGAIYISDQTILFGTNKLYKSSNQGASWQEITTHENGIEATASVYAIISNGNFVYASTGAGVFYTPDNGESWTKLPNKDEFFDKVFRLASNDNYIFGVDQYNIHRISRMK